MPPASSNGTCHLSALQPVLETALDAVVAMGADGTVLDWNARAEGVFGWTRDEAVGREVTELVVPKWARAAHIAGLRRVLSNGPPRILGQRIEISALRRDGSEFPVELSIVRPLSVQWPNFSRLHPRHLGSEA